MCYFGDLGAKIPGLATFKKSILEIRKRSPVPKLCSKKERQGLVIFKDKLSKLIHGVSNYCKHGRGVSIWFLEQKHSKIWRKWAFSIRFVTVLMKLFLINFEYSCWAIYRRIFWCLESVELNIEVSWCDDWRLVKVPKLCSKKERHDWRLVSILLFFYVSNPSNWKL